MSQHYSEHLTYHAIVQGLVARAHATEHAVPFTPFTPKATS